MDASRGSITVTTLIGTGAVTLGVALSGLAGVGGDLRAADAVNQTTPVITTQDLSDTLREERRSPKWDGTGDCPPQPGGADDSQPSGVDDAVIPKPTPAPTPAEGASSKEI